MILVIDNYDSFTYNIVQYLGELGQECKVFRNDQITVNEIRALSPNYIVISPGPCTPDEAGVCLDVIKDFAGEVPMLGICLGHQSIAQAFGGKIIRSPKMMHGKTSKVDHDGLTIFKNIPSPFTAMRYHSLIVESESVPDEFNITSKTDEGEIMSIRHRQFPIEGVQFHPESISTEFGKELLLNFINSYKLEVARG